MKKKLLAFIYSATITIGSISSIPIYASVTPDNFAIEAEPRFDYIKQTRAYLEIANNGIATVQGQLNASDCDSVGITVKLQQYTSGSWKTVSTWTATGSTRCSLEKSKAISSGYTYRVEVVGKVYDSSGKVLESHTEYSNTVFF